MSKQKDIVIDTAKYQKLQIVHHIENKETLKEYLKDIPSKTIIQNAEDYKIMNEYRLQLKRLVKAIDRQRIDRVKDFTHDFVASCEELVGMIEEKLNPIIKSLEDYDLAQEEKVKAEEKEKVYKAIFKYKDNSLTMKIKEFAQKYNIEIEIKE